MRTLTILLSLLLLALPALAQETLRDKAQQYQQLQQEAQALFKDQKWSEAADKFREMIKLAPNHPAAHYNLACALARQDKPDDAVAALRQAIAKGYNDADHMTADPDLATLRTHKSWEDLLAKAKENAQATGTYDAPIDIPDVKTIEAAPEGGLKYRFRLPKNPDPQKPARLIVWLHPSGGSMNSTVEKLSPELTKRGYALLVPTHKQWRGWTAKEARQLMEKTLPHAAKTEGLDADKPILMGFSAGGQIALQLWQTRPDAFGGLILSAAYPVTQGNNGVQPLPLPEDKVARQATPILAAVGSNDGGAKLWERTQPAWQDAGIPLQLEIVPEGRHEWLLKGPTLTRTYQWLDAVKSGKRPADAPASQPATQKAP